MDDEIREREELLGAAHRVIESARAGTGGTVVFEGPAGIGKSTLLDVVATSAGAITVARAAPTELERAFPFGVVCQLFGPLVALVSPSKRERLFRGPAAAARRVLEAAESLPAVTDVSHAAMYGLLWLLADFAAQQPVLLLVDDAQWADEPSLAWLGFAGSRLASIPAALVAATRPPSPAEDGALAVLLAARRNVEVLAVPPLSAAAVTAIVRDSIGAEAAVERTRHAVTATGGNPFLLAELIRGWAQRPDDATPLTTAALRRTIRQRVRRAGPDGARLADAVAVLGGARVELRHAAALAGLELQHAARVAAALAHTDVLGTELPLAFEHPLVHAAVYDSIPAPRRAVAHRAAAVLLHDDGIELDSVGAHLLRAIPVGDAWSVARLREAARRASARGAMDGAVALLRRALAEPPTQRERRLVLHELGAAEVRARDPAAEGHLRAALDGADGPDLAEAAITLARFLIGAGRGVDANRVLERARSSVGDDTELGLRIECEQFAAARTEPGIVALPRRSTTREHSELRGDTAGERLILASLTFEAGIAGAPSATIRSLAARALSDGKLLRAEGPEGLSFYFVVYALGQTDAYAQALEYLNDALEESRVSGSVAGYALARAWRADVLLRMGALREVEADALDALALAAEHELRTVPPVALMALTCARVDAGSLDQAEEDLRALGFMETIPPAGLFAGVHYARGRLNAARGDLHAAARDFLAAGAALLAARVTTPAAIPWRSDAAVALVVHDRGQAGQLAADELARARTLAAPRPLGLALRARALVGPASERAAGLALAAEQLRAARSPVELARTLIDLGVAQLRVRRRDSALDLLREALDLSDRHGAARLAERADQELRVAGARPRRRRVAGPEALTAAELRVARLAAAGHSNREIAAELFLTAKTIESHLGHAYAKLSITGRGELKTALAGD